MKPPKNIPTDVGQRVRLRGRPAYGEIVYMNGTWMWVAWDEPDMGALICHQHELECRNPNL
jgi:hypothetical protein